MRVKLSLFLLFLCLPVVPFNQILASNMSNNSNTSIKHVAIVFSTGGLGDKSFNDAAFAGAQMANDTSKVKIDYAVPKTVQDINTYVEQFASMGIYDLIITIGYSSADGVNASSIAHPNQQFAIVDDNSINRSNVADITFKEQEGSFLAGAMAAMTTRSNVLGFLGGLNIPLINKFRSGYEQGAHYINFNITVISQYSPDPSNPWGDTAGGRQVANTEINQGADIIYAAAGGTGLGVFDVVNASRSAGNIAYAIGVDSNQDYIQPGIILTSMVKRVDTAVYDLIEATIGSTLSSKYMGQWQQLGLAQNGVGLTNMTFTSYVKNSDCTGTTTRGDVINTLKQDIIDGKIVVNPLLLTASQMSAQYNIAHACSITAPSPFNVTTTTSPITTSTSTTSTSKLVSQSSTHTITSTPGFTIFMLVPLILIVYKKRK